MTCINHEVPFCVMPRYVYSGALCLHTHLILFLPQTHPLEPMSKIIICLSVRSAVWEVNGMITVFKLCTMKFVYNLYLIISS